MNQLLLGINNSAVLDTCVFTFFLSYIYRYGHVCAILDRYITFKPN